MADRRVAAPLTEETFADAVVELGLRDRRLREAVRTHGPPPFWHRAPGFATLVLFILEQQVSLASARAAFDRLEAVVETIEPDALLSLDDAALRSIGFSRQKARYVRSLAEAVIDGLDLNGLARLDDDAVRNSLTALPGIGAWTADVYLLSCLRRPDVWPAGDRALQVAAGEVLGLAEVPAPRELVEIARPWIPHRASAARILWHAYLTARGRS